jgi:hypothetical protein
MTDPFEEMLARGVVGYDPGEVRHLLSLRARANEERFAARLARLEAAFDETRDAVSRHLYDAAFDDETHAEMQAAFGAGDYVQVEILASTRPRAKPSSPLRDAWLEKIRKRAEERGLGLDSGGARIADALLSVAAIEARAAAIADEARALDLETIGPYNPWALALRVLGRLDELSPSYLASWVGFLEDVAALEPEVEQPKKTAAPAKKAKPRARATGSSR